MADPRTTPGPAGGTRYMCPLCDWYHDQEPVTALPLPAEYTHGVLTYTEALHAAAVRTLTAEATAVESVIRTHLETHPLTEWVEVAVKLDTIRRALNDVTAPLAGAQPPDPARLLDLVCEGKLAVNDVRWVNHARGVVEALKRELARPEMEARRG